MDTNYFCFCICWDFCISAHAYKLTNHTICICFWFWKHRSELFCSVLPSPGCFVFQFHSIIFLSLSSSVSLTESPSYCANEEEEGGGGYKVNSLALASVDRIFGISANFALNPPTNPRIRFCFSFKKRKKKKPKSKL